VKQNEIWSRPRGCVQKIFQTLLPNVGIGDNDSCQNLHPILHGVNESKQNGANVS